MSSRMHTELAFTYRTMMASIPSTHATAEQRADFQLFKAEFWETYSVLHPESATQALFIADRARHAAQEIALGY